MKTIKPIKSPITGGETTLETRGDGCLFYKCVDTGLQFADKHTDRVNREMILRKFRLIGQ